MNTLTLYQPWASLIAVEAKKFETRHWSTSYRGPFAIHAGKKKPSDSLTGMYIDICMEMMRSLGLKTPSMSDIMNVLDRELPLGKVVCITEFVECYLIGQDAGGTFIAKKSETTGQYVKYQYIKDKTELMFGNWTPGRFAFEVKNVKRLPVPIPARGLQGVWPWDEAGLK